jgi:GT2 family glycosyltransferase
VSAVAASLLDVDAIMVAHGSAACLEDAVRSVEEQVPLGRVFVVDAGSADGVVAAVAAAHPYLHVIGTEHRGLAAASSVGIEATKGEFVLLLDADAVLEEACVGPLVSRARSNRRAGVVAPLVAGPDGKTKAGSSGPFPSLQLALYQATDAMLRRRSKHQLVAPPEAVEATTVDWVSGTCMLIRRAAVEATGPLDAGFVECYWDIELCQRMHQAGWMVLTEPTATCVDSRTQTDESDHADAERACHVDFARYCRMFGLSGLAMAERVGLASPHPAGARTGGRRGRRR